MDFLWGLLIGCIVGIIMIPIGIKIMKKIKDVNERRFIKKALYNNQIIKPIDKRDFDTNMWKDKIEVDKLDDETREFSDRMFKTGKFQNNKEFLGKEEEIIPKSQENIDKKEVIEDGNKETGNRWETN